MGHSKPAICILLTANKCIFSGNSPYRQIACIIYAGLEASVHIRSSTGCKHVLRRQLPPCHSLANLPIHQPSSSCPTAMQIEHAFRITKNYTFIKFRGTGPWTWED